MALSRKVSTSLFQPIVTPILESRPLCVTLTGAALMQSALVAFNKPGWICPTREYLGCPCPGCGLTRAVAALFSGDLQTMMAYHALAPFFVIGFSFVVAAAVLPHHQRQRLITAVDWSERRSGIATIFLITLFCYWFVRLVIFNQAYFNLIF